MKGKASTAARDKLWQQVKKQSEKIKQLKAQVTKLESTPKPERHQPNYKSAESELLHLIYEDLSFRCDFKIPATNEIDMSNGIWSELVSHAEGRGEHAGRLDGEDLLRKAGEKTGVTSWHLSEDRELVGHVIDQLYYFTGIVVENE